MTNITIRCDKLAIVCHVAINVLFVTNDRKPLLIGRETKPGRITQVWNIESSTWKALLLSYFHFLHGRGWDWGPAIILSGVRLLSSTDSRSLKFLNGCETFTLTLTPARSVVARLVALLLNLSIATPWQACRPQLLGKRPSVDYNTFGKNLTCKSQINADKYHTFQQRL